jgi:hypothetical protein
MELSAAPPKRRASSLVAGAVGLPIAAISIYLWLTRWPARTDTSSSDYIAVTACVFLGLIFVAFLPVAGWVRALLVAAYAPAAFAVLVVYSLLFVGFAFGDWL